MNFCRARTLSRGPSTSPQAHTHPDRARRERPTNDLQATAAGHEDVLKLRRRRRGVCT